MNIVVLIDTFARTSNYINNSVAWLTYFNIEKDYEFNQKSGLLMK